MSTTRRTSRILMHGGNSLMHLSSIYAGAAETFEELLQNAIDIDVGATQIEVIVNLKDKRIIIRDNGQGASIEMFEKALATVAHEDRKGQGSIGRFGIGLLSPLGKCKSFTFTSRERSVRDSPFNEWTFDAADLKARVNELEVPCVSRDDLTNNPHPRRKQHQVWWTTEVHMKDINCAVELSKMSAEKIVSNLQSRFGVILTQNKVLLNVIFVDLEGRKVKLEHVKTERFRGEKLPQITYKLENIGHVNLILYRVPFSTRAKNGEIVFGVAGRPDRLKGESVLKAAEAFAPKEVIAALQSGHIEGEIIGEMLKTKSNRKSFEIDSTFVDLCIALEWWYKEHGKKIIEEFQEEDRASRYQKLGLRSMTVIEQLLKLPQNFHLQMLVEGFRHGHTGDGHAPLPEKRLTGEETVTALATTGKPGESKTGTGTGKPKPRNTDNDREENPDHKPFAVAGPNGRKRKLVKGSSSGLMFAFEMMEGSSDIWQLDMQRGELTFNIRHPAWQACEKVASHQMRLQEIIALNALLLETMNEAQRPIQKAFVEHQIDVLVSWITSADKARQESNPDL